MRSMSGFLTVGDGDNHSFMRRSGGRGDNDPGLLQRVIYNVCLGLDDYPRFYIAM